jgi:2,4-dienoyl-CoA reductase-like NADH-dependent reductase (Old Yellow Enzyme family)
MTRPLLFTPLAIRGIELKNRIMISPMAMYSAVDGVVNDFHLAHHGRFALGGAGTVLFGATAVTREGRITNGCAGLWDDKHIAPFRRITGLMHNQGVVPGIQLGHAGRKGSMQRPWEGNGPLTAENIAAGAEVWQPVGPTADPMDEGYLTPHVLTVADLAKLRDDWVAVAQRAIAAGFDWLEIHNAHGYLVHQFLSPLSNTRDDGYGGDFEGRVRWPLELAAALRETWPADRPVSLRISAVDGDALGWQMPDSVEYARRLKKIGIDLVCTSSGGLKGSATNARVRRDFGYHVPYAAEVRRETGMATIAVGLIVDPHHAERILQNGEADIIAIGREALVNPCWPQMAEIALGRPMMEALDDWPVQYAWWLKFRERTIAELRQHPDDGADP